MEMFKIKSVKDFYEVFDDAKKAESLKAELQNIADNEITQFLNAFLPGGGRSFPNNINIEFSKYTRPTLIKAGVDVTELAYRLKEFLRKCNEKELTGKCFDSHIIESLNYIMEVFENSYIGATDRKVRPNEVQDSIISANIMNLERFIEISTESKDEKSELDLEEVKEILDDLIEREIWSVCPGFYNHRNNTITLYLRAMSRTVYSREGAVLAAFAHELFLAYHFVEMQKAGERWDTAKSYEHQIVAESLASYFEYSYAKFVLGETDMAAGIMWDCRFDTSYWPYSGAKAFKILADDNVTRIEETVGSRLFEMVFEDSLKTWDFAYQDLCVLERAMSDEYRIRFA